MLIIDSESDGTVAGERFFPICTDIIWYTIAKRLSTFQAKCNLMK
jgi:hypothetical protein